jgi:hypothetical protein
VTAAFATALGGVLGFVAGCAYTLWAFYSVIRKVERDLDISHHYVSHACAHGDHHACMPCEWCDEPCRCTEPGCPHRYRPVHRVVKSWTLRLPNWAPIPGRERRRDRAE